MIKETHTVKIMRHRKRIKTNIKIKKMLIKYRIKQRYK